jgi:hypothetical protein
LANGTSLDYTYVYHEGQLGYPFAKIIIMDDTSF